jgi:hypothetical protein
MSARPTFDPRGLEAAFGIARPPLILDRAGRVSMIGEAAKALLDGQLPSRECAVFLGGALLSWLELGGNLEREYLRVTKAKSHHTPAAIWRSMNAHRDERQGCDDAADCKHHNTTEEREHHESK